MTTDILTNTRSLAVVAARGRVCSLILPEGLGLEDSYTSMISIRSCSCVLTRQGKVGPKPGVLVASKWGGHRRSD